MDHSGYADWKAPAEDGAVVVWPDAERLLGEVEHNRTELSTAQTPIQGVPIARLREIARQNLNHPADRPLIATGHQTELYHPGVWVKGAVIDAIARRCGGAAVHFAVDTDQPKHLSFKWPGDTRPVTDDPALTTAEWSGRLAGPSSEYLQGIRSAVTTAAAAWPFAPVIGPFFDSLEASGLGLSASVTAAESAVDRSLGLDVRAQMVSPMLASVPYLVFVHHVLACAGEFAAAYNTALSGYRVENGIKSDTRPMPDLGSTSDRVEVPFWLDSLGTGGRGRANVVRSDGQWALKSRDDEFRFDPSADGMTAAGSLGAWLDSHRLRLSPRALTLTTFLRLLVVDQFVHGIGGGRYDQVTDRLIATFFGITPPRFAVATATLFFPGAVGQPRVCLPCLKMEGHRLRHNLLGERKREVLAAIDSLPRRSVQRSLAFHNMHGALSAAAIDHPAIAEFNRRFQEATVRLNEEADLFDRELFYALQPRERLLMLMMKVRAEMGGGQ
jgi:hypothetical protein